MQVIAINGSGGCGKDSFVRQFAMANEGGVVNCSTIDPIKQLALQIGWDGNKDERSRKFLSDLKDLLTEFNDLSFNYVGRVIEEYKDSDYLFVHCREPQEIDKMVKAYGAKSILITADTRVPIIESNHADRLVKEYDYDYIVTNVETLQELNEKAIEILNKLNGE